MKHLMHISSGAALAGALAVLAACTPTSSQPSGGQVASTPPASQPSSSPQLCRLTKPDGSRCVTMQQLPMQPAATDQGYATQLTWVLTNECSYPMLVSWGWGAASPRVGEAVLAQGQSTQVSCLWNIDGCTGAIDWVYRCSQPR
jgi:hypothetical protein